MKGSEKKRSRFFPSPSSLVDHPDPDGVVAVDGELSLSNLLEAYGLGIFPWPTEVRVSHRGPTISVLLWFCPHERAILEYGAIRIPKSLGKAQRRIEKSGELRFSENEAFREVMKACAEAPRPGQSGSWITDEMLEAYCGLHNAGHAHSVEVWNSEGELVGGVYGVEVDGIFSAESMFHRVDNASKLALLHLMDRLHARGIEWIDIQMMTPHLEKLGARVLSRRDYLTLLQRSRRSPH